MSNDNTTASCAQLPPIVAAQSALLPQWHNIPAGLRERAQWCLAGPDKSPRDLNGYNVSPTDPSKWMDFETACRAAREKVCHLGYMLSVDDPFTVIDLDVKGDVKPEDFETHIQMLDSYTERSMSGKGFHVWVEGRVEKAAKAPHIEIYSQDRFMICTGNVVRDRSIMNRDALVKDLAGQWHGRHPSHSELDVSLATKLWRAFQLTPAGQREKTKRLDYFRSTMGVATNDNRFGEGSAEHGQVIAENLLNLKDDTLLIPRLVTDEMWNTAKPTRPTIVDCWLYQDVGCLFAPGGVGKTTLLLFQVIHIVLGLDLFGYRVMRPGSVIYMTAEDDRETLIARLRLMCQEIGLSPEQTLRVRNNVHIIDVSGHGIKLTQVEKDVVIPTKYVPKMIEKWKPYRPSAVFIDPAVSFGVGESRVNDAEQGLIDAARRIRNELLCGVLYVHHTGKENARKKTLDQYSGRNGSAFSDGSRMVHVMQSLEPEEWTAATGDTLEPGESGIIYARPKITWAPANQLTIYLKRQGYLYTRYNHIDSEASAEVTLDKNVQKINAFLRDEWARGHKYSKDDLEKKKGFMRRDELREALSHMTVHKMLVAEAESLGARGAPRKVLRPQDV